MREITTLAGILLACTPVTPHQPPRFEMEIKTVNVFPVDPAHTDGDSFVRFHKANVLNMGDCYLPGSFPVVDHSNGGVLSGIIAAADAALGTLDSSSRIIPGHGAVASVQDLREWRGMIATIHERVATLVAAGKTLEQVKAERPTQDWDGRLTRSFVTSAHVIEEAYREAVARK